MKFEILSCLHLLKSLLFKLLFEFPPPRSQSFTATATLLPVRPYCPTQIPAPLRLPPNTRPSGASTSSTQSCPAPRHHPSSTPQTARHFPDAHAVDTCLLSDFGGGRERRCPGRWRLLDCDKADTMGT
ncbi:hypothetical protein BAUCODRAFT_332045 [Baudoinia panamericana UAMH 10762]|uniref:Uncharacterized protein n=1 Tax=Baudoinia panamericana (strain UAMH 10762) TaxID=717646 RepID=M2MI56_BAUPA|nr:uncharacterized protein BAUCODRAFT_332045 [Baudoinia panamericana UAMH 10762]EMC90948.1 hypothetical protein BAUCODRAFT_332045 [Baudoinia panamericana UAMH 10762]